MTVIPFPTPKHIQRRKLTAPTLDRDSVRDFQNALQEQLLEATKCIVEQEILYMLTKLNIEANIFHACLAGGRMEVVIHFTEESGYAEFSSTLPAQEEGA